MPAVGIVLLLIGLWIVVRTLAGNLASHLTRTSSSSGEVAPGPEQSPPPLTPGKIPGRSSKTGMQTLPRYTHPPVGTLGQLSKGSAPAPPLTSAELLRREERAEG